MKAFKNFILTVILTFILTFIGIVVSSKIFVPKWVGHDMNMMTFIVKGFYEEPKNSLDVVILGNSDTYRGVSPMVMYKEYGIASYSFVSAGQRMWQGYAMFEDVLRTQNPKIILFNVDGMFSDNQANDGNHSKVYDNMPFSMTKIKAVYDENYEATWIRRFNHLFPVFQYHNRYTDLSSDDFKYAFYDYHYALKGMEMVAYREAYTGDLDYMKDKGEKTEIPEINEYYLDKMREECEKKGIKLVLFHIPSTESASYARYYGIKDYADNYNLDFLEMNFYNDEIGIDWTTDTADAGDHLNLFGAEKVAKYLGKWLKDNYELPDRRNDKKYKQWDKDYKIYLKTRKQEINDAKNEGRY